MNVRQVLAIVFDFMAHNFTSHNFTENIDKKHLHIYTGQLKPQTDKRANATN